MQKRRIFIGLFIVIIALLGLRQPAHAEQLNNNVKKWVEEPEQTSKKDKKISVDEKEQASDQVGITFWDFLRMIFALIFVVILLYFLLKFINKKSRSFKTSQMVENLGGTALGANRSVQVIKVGSQILVVGVGENIQLLKEITDQDEYNSLIEEYNSKMDSMIEPADVISKLIEKAKNRKIESNQDGLFSSLLKNQLEDLKEGRKKVFEVLEKKGPDKNE